MLFAADVRILNLSDGGVAIEAEKRMNMGADYVLKLKDLKTSLALRGVVVWSYITNSRHTDTGDSVPIYHAGLQFRNLSEEQYKELQRFLNMHQIAKQNRLNSLRFIIGGDHTSVVSYPFDYEVKMLSLGGMLIRSNQSFELNQTFPMAIELGHQVSVRFTGRIASCLEKQSGGKNFFDVGIAFTNVSDKDQINIEEYLKLLEEKSAA